MQRQYCLRCIFVPFRQPQGAEMNICISPPTLLGMQVGVEVEVAEEVGAMQGCKYVT